MLDLYILHHYFCSCYFYFRNGNGPNIIFRSPLMSCANFMLKLFAIDELQYCIVRI